MLTTSATIAFLLVASSLAALAVHEWLGGGRRRSGGSSDASQGAVDQLGNELRGELDDIQDELADSRAALTEESRRLEALMAQGADGNSMEAIESAVARIQARSEELGQKIELRGQSCIQAGAQHESAIAATFNEARSGQAELRQDLEQLSRAMADMSAQVVDVERAAVNGERIQAIEASVEEIRNGQATDRVAELESLVMELMAKVDGQPAITDFESRIVGLESQCAELASSRISEDRLAQLEQSFYSQDLRLCTLEDDFASAPAPGVQSAGTEPSEPEPIGPNNRDDLKKIKGIGAVLEQTLNSLGIQRLEQVANLSIDQIEELSEHLGAFASRLERDKWIEQARELVG